MDRGWSKTQEVRRAMATMAEVRRAMATAGAASGEDASGGGRGGGEAPGARDGGGNWARVSVAAPGTEAVVAVALMEVTDGRTPGVE